MDGSLIGTRRCCTGARVISEAEVERLRSVRRNRLAVRSAYRRPAVRFVAIRRKLLPGSDSRRPGRSTGCRRAVPQYLWYAADAAVGDRLGRGRAGDHGTATTSVTVLRVVIA